MDLFTWSFHVTHIKVTYVCEDLFTLDLFALFSPCLASTLFSSLSFIHFSISAKHSFVFLSAFKNTQKVFCVYCVISNMLNNAHKNTIIQISPLLQL